MKSPEEYTQAKLDVLKRLTNLSRQVIVMNPQSNERSVKNIERDMQNLKVELGILTDEKS